MKKVNFKKNIFILFTFLFPFQAYSALSKKDIQKLNNTLIFDLFLNYELSVKNGNLSTLVDFLPTNISNNNFKHIKLITNVGGDRQECNINFNPKGYIEKIVYDVEDTRYRYDLIYKRKKLSRINIADKPKISFEYGKKGRLTKIIRERGAGIAFEYNFEYLDDKNRANISLVVIQNGQKQKSSANYYVTWDSELRLESFCFEEYCSDNIKYTPEGDIASYVFSTSLKDGNVATWEYTKRDNKQNWIERESIKTFCKREIEYN